MKARWTCGCTAAVLMAVALTGCSGTPTTPSANTPSQPAPNPSPKRTVTGVVVSIDGHPVGGARISGFPSVQATSAPDGTFAFDFPADQYSELEVTATGYEPGYLTLLPGPLVVRPVRLQPRVVVAPGLPVRVQLTNDHPALWVGEPYESDSCGPCKVIRFAVPLNPLNRPVTEVRVEWTGPDALQMWAANGLLAERDGRTLVVRTIDRVYIGLGRTSGVRTLTEPVTLTLTAQ